MPPCSFYCSSRYAIGRFGRRSIKWWHRLFYWLLDVAIVNAFILKKIKMNTKLDQLSFRLRLAQQLIDGFSNRKRKVTAYSACKKGAVGVPDDVRLSNVGHHLPMKTSTRRRCRVCSSTKKETRTIYTCKSCSVPLCIDKCFEKFHSK